MEDWLRSLISLLVEYHQNQTKQRSVLIRWMEEKTINQASLLESLN